MNKTTKSTEEELENDESPLEIESFCTNCENNGLTKILTTTIPFYKQVIIMSFECDHCGFKNNEIRSGEPDKEFGKEIVLNVKEKRDLNRTVAKSEFASIEVPELKLTIPTKSQPGEITNVEGILSRVKLGLQQDQAERFANDSTTAEKIEDFIKRLNELIELKQPWTLKLKDPSGNCFIENPDPIHVDANCITTNYCRSIEENKLLGLVDDDETMLNSETDKKQEWTSYEDCKNEVLRFKESCSHCGFPVETYMKPTDIPYFQTVIIMSTHCDNCGYKSNDIKSGGPIHEQGVKLTITIENEIDLARDVLKSDTCTLLIPDLEIEIGPGALSGRFTTVEGILVAVKEQLQQQVLFFLGDSIETEKRQKLEKILQELDNIKTLKRKGAKLILDDPTGNSYIMSLTAPLDDVQLKKEFYTRTFEQNEELGLNDIKVENYQEPETIKEENEENE